MKKILVSRFSALGDVTIAVHVLKAVIEQNDSIEIVLLTKAPFKKLFENIDRVTCFDVDLKNSHSGFKGIKRLAKEILNQHKIDVYIDLHNVLRTKLLKIFLPNKIKKTVINKGRKNKKKLTKKKNKNIHQLKHSADRYAETFQKAGINIDLSLYNPSYNYKTSSELNFFLEKFPGDKIAIAPFAAHSNKMLSIEKTEEIFSLTQKNTTFFILGGGQKEKELAEKWENQFENVYSVIGKFHLIDEISLINNCRITITMDSGNMHLASLTNTKIISIWGATHPFLGFSPYKKENTVYIQKEIFCRPCSVFGNKKCYRDKLYCLDIDTKTIIKNI